MKEVSHRFSGIFTAAVKRQADWSIACLPPKAIAVRYSRETAAWRKARTPEQEQGVSAGPPPSHEGFCAKMDLARAVPRTLAEQSLRYSRRAACASRSIFKTTAKPTFKQLQ
jgi:hypothetical protein